MKKLFVSALAIVSMVACSMDETVNTQAPASIAFDGAFVEKATRAEDPSTTTANINEFYVWAVMNEVDGLVFNGETGETVTKGSNGWTYQNIQYWTPSKSYYFAALAGNLNDVELALTADNGMVSKAGLTNLAAFENKNGTNDLLYAESVVETPAVISAAPAKVKFQFAHLLSKVKFSFTNGFQNKNNYIVIENITMAVPATGEIDLTADELAWANQAGNLTLAMGTMDNAAKVAINETAECDFERLTIPATAAQEYTVKFDVTLYNGNQVASTAQKTVKISGVELKMGHSYNFKATINKDNVDENPLFPIEFDVEVDEWIEETVDGGVVATNAVSTEAELAEAIVDGGLITLAQDIVLTENATLVFGANANTTRAAEPVATVIDLAGHTLSGVSTKTGANFNMIDVNGGNLTIKNGAIVYEHKGANMEWNSSTNIFNVTAGGVLNLDGVTAKNLGGSDMGFVAHLNNWGKVTLNVENSTLESNYVAVRVFNSGNDINNVAIHNSTLKGGNYAFWVHNYTVADFGSEDKAAAKQALLNFDIFNGTNTFVGKTATPVRFGFTNSIYFDSLGFESTIARDQDELNKVLVAGARIYVSDGEYTLASYPAGVTLIGAGENVVFDVQGKKFGVHGDVTIENAKLVFSNANYTGFQHTNVESYKNCTIVGQPFLYGNKVTFEGCTFEQTSADAYNVWTYGAADVEFVNCVFNSAGKSVLIYHESLNTQNVKLEGCVLNASAPVAGKAAIEIDSSLIKGAYNVTINGTTANGFAEGNVSGNTLWNNKKGTKTNITVDGKAVLVIGYDAAVDNSEAGQATMKETAAAGGDVILAEDVTTMDTGSNGYGSTGVLVNGGTFDGNGHTIAVEGATSTWDSAIAISSGTIKNVTVAKGFRGIFFKNGTEKIVLENVVVKGPTYTISCDQAGKQGFEAYNSKFYGWTSYAGTIGTGYFEGCTFGAGAGYNFSRPYAPTTYVNCTFEAGHAIDARAKVSFENCTFNGVALTSENIATLVTGNVQNVQEVK